MIDGQHRLGRTLLVVGATPFALSLVRNALGDPAKVNMLCPFRFLTGFPCPLCGGTRAFSKFVAGDASFLNYGAFWVFLAALLIGLGAVGILGASRGALPLHSLRQTVWPKSWPNSWFALTAFAVVMLLGWSWALYNRGFIVT